MVMRASWLLFLLFLTHITFAQQGQRPLPEGISAKRDVAYVTGGTERQRLDVFYPTKAEKPVPLVVWIHGGAWMGGSKEGGPARRLLDDGFAVASVTYRFSQHAKFPAQIEDCKAAIRWLRAHAKELNIDPERIGAWGSSAGGHLVAMLGVTGDKKEWERGENLDQSSAVQAVVDWFGPTNLLTMGAQALPDSRIDHDAANSPESKLVGGPVQENKDAASAASPVTYVSAGDAPILLVHGDRDNVVPPKQSDELHAALKKAGIETSLTIIPGAAHGDGGFREPKAFEEARDFLRKHLKH
jgi:acetyl esterase/lipase